MSTKKRKVESAHHAISLRTGKRVQELPKQSDVLHVHYTKFSDADEPQTDVYACCFVDAGEGGEVVWVAWVGAVDGVCGADGYGVPGVGDGDGGEEGVVVDLRAEFDGKDGEREGVSARRLDRCGAGVGCSQVWGAFQHVFFPVRYFVEKGSKRREVW